MDSLFFKAGINGIAPPITVAGVGSLEVRTSHPSQINAAAVGRSSTPISVEKPSVSSPQKNSPWGFSFRYPLRSLWPRGGKNRYDAAIAVEDAAVLVDEKEDKEEERMYDENREQDGSWVLKILHVKSLWKQEEQIKAAAVEEKEEISNHQQQSREECNNNGDEDCDVCKIDDGNDESLEFDRDSFSKLLQKVSLTEARLYARMSFLGNLAYSIPQIKPANLLRYHGLRFVTSSFENKEQALKADKERALSAENQQKEENASSKKQQEEKKRESAEETKETSSLEAQESGDQQGEQVQCEEINKGNRISAAAAYQIAASAASYLHSHTKSILPFVFSKSTVDEDLPLSYGSMETEKMTNEDVASLMATTDSVTAVVAAKEEVKQAVADDLNSKHSSPCEWFVCDDDQSGTRFFVIQGSESLASWQANLLFEPIEFEGLDVLVHRGIYEAAKGMFEQMLPEVRAHMKSYGKRATFRFTGHSLGGSLSLLINLMLLIRGEVPSSSLLPVITFGAPAVMCGGDRLLLKLGLPQSHVKSITMHRDIVPRAFSCHYPNHVAEFLKAVNGNFRSLPCLNNQNLLYAPMGDFLILQPDEKFSPKHDLLPSGSGLYLLSCPVSDVKEAKKQFHAAQAVFLNSPHPLEILSDRGAYGTGGTIQRDHDMNSYMKSVRNVIRKELHSLRKARRQHRRKVWWPLVAASKGVNASITVGRPVAFQNIRQVQFNFSGIFQTGKQSLKRFSTLVASQHMHLLVVLLFPARLLILGTLSTINLH